MPNRFRIVWGVVCACAVGAGGADGQVPTPANRGTTSGTTTQQRQAMEAKLIAKRLGVLPDSVLVRLAMIQRPEEKVDACKAALSQGLSKKEAVQVTWELAKAYERVKGCGDLARKTYVEIIERYPDDADTPEAAYRMGELHECIILPGTKRDAKKAIQYYELVLATASPGRYVRLKAHMTLGGLGAGPGHFEAIYDFDPATLKLDPQWESASPEEQAKQRRYLEGRVKGIKETVRPGLISACTYRVPDSVMLSNLDALLNRHPNDLELMKLADQEAARIIQKADVQTGNPLFIGDKGGKELAVPARWQGLVQTQGNSANGTKQQDSDNR